MSDSQAEGRCDHMAGLQAGSGLVCLPRLILSVTASAYCNAGSGVKGATAA